MTGNLKHDIDLIIAKHGHAAPVMLLAALVGWQTKWLPPLDQEQNAKAGYLLGQAAEILERIEATEAIAREANP